MTVKRSVIGFIILFFIFLSSASSYGFERPKQILIVHSYNDQYTWTNDEMAGMEEVLYFNYDSVTLRVEYLDSKNNSEAWYFEAFGKMLELKYANEQIDAIICADDNAFNLVLDIRESVFEDVPLFFCGINQLEKDRVMNQRNLYGLVEKSSAYETVEVILQQDPKINKLYFVLDETISGKLTQTDIVEELSVYENIEKDFMDEKSFEEILDTIENAEENAVLIYGFYVVDRSKETYTIEYTTKMVSERSKVPVYGLWSFSMDHGIVGGKLISGYEHGKGAAYLLVDYFNGRDFGGNNYLEYSISNTFMFDYKAVHSFGLDMGKLPPSSIIINRPDTFFRRHRSVILWSLGIMVALIFHNIVLRKRVKNRTIDLEKSLIRVKKTQEKLVESEKLASLGGLVFGVAHEINTPLGNSLTLATFLQKENLLLRDRFIEGKLKKTDMALTTESMNHSLSSLVRNLEKATSLVNAFKSIAVGSETDTRIEFDLEEYLRNLVLTYRSSYGESKYDILLNCPQNIILFGKPSQYHQIVSPLLSNSIVHGFRNQQQGIVEIDLFIKEQVLYLNYSDNGIGLSEEQMKHVFEPFYTSRRGEGHSGLGMFTVYNAVKSLNGDLEFMKGRKSGLSLMIKIPMPKKE